MEIRYNKVLLSKVVLLLVMLFVGGLAFWGCARGSIPQGWSGVEASNGTLFLGSMGGDVIAVNESSGARLWEQHLETSKKGVTENIEKGDDIIIILGEQADDWEKILNQYKSKYYNVGRSAIWMQWSDTQDIKIIKAGE